MRLNPLPSTTSGLLFMSSTSLARLARVAMAAALTLPLLAACSDNKDGGTVTGPVTTRVYSQAERLGNPLVSEVFFMKRDHGLHNNTAQWDRLSACRGPDTHNRCGVIKAAIHSLTGR